MTTSVKEAPNGVVPPVKKAKTKVHTITPVTPVGMNAEANHEKKEKEQIMILEMRNADAAGDDAMLTL